MSTTQSAPQATPEQRERIETLAALVEAEKPDIIRRLHLCEAAEREPGFNGDLRRAIHAAGKPLEQLAAVAQVGVFQLCDFLEGTSELTSGQIQKLVSELGLQLVRPIPPMKERSK